MYQKPAIMLCWWAPLQRASFNVATNTMPRSTRLHTLRIHSTRSPMMNWTNTRKLLRKNALEIVRIFFSSGMNRLIINRLFFAVTDTDYSESEALSSLPISGQVKSPIMSPPSQSEPEDAGLYFIINDS